MDKYDEAVAFYLQHPECIHDHWLQPEKNKPHSCLFQWATPSGGPADEKGRFSNSQGSDYGDPIQVCYHRRVSVNHQLTHYIRKLTQMPMGPGFLDKKGLQYLARTQRYIDRQLKRS